MASRRDLQPRRALMIQLIAARMADVDERASRWSPTQLGAGPSPWHGRPHVVAPITCASEAVADILIERLGTHHSWLASVEPAHRGPAIIDAATACVVEELGIETDGPLTRVQIMAVRVALYERAEPFLVEVVEEPSLEPPSPAPADEALAQTCELRWPRSRSPTAARVHASRARR